MSVRLITGDCREELPKLETGSVNCCVTSPPYYRLRAYLPANHPLKAKEMGSEQKLDCLGWATRNSCGICFICELVGVFREVRRVLRKDGVAWINLGDSYASAPNGPVGSKSTLEGSLAPHAQHRIAHAKRSTRLERGFKHKDMFGAPWRLAMALQADGWWWRDVVVWHKPNPMPSSVNDRCTPSWEPVLMMTPSARYFFDWKAITTTPSPETKQLSTDTMDFKRRDKYKMPDGWDTGPGAHGSFHRNGMEKGRRNSFARDTKDAGGKNGKKPQHRPEREPVDYDQMARKRNVWSIATAAFSEAHYATFPPALPEVCIKASCPPGGVVLDPWGGAGTVALVADRLQRDAIIIELNEDNTAMSRKRISGDSPLFAEVA